ncbi:hypothetical protein CLV33_10625 [Jejuia pallidilutea]|uniref:Uncharacterized protein n=1 Tax=Jejuia pallidilutea TaxID=504487 RepID=A0A362X7Y8_9FLAO|nr:hypothetical protein [Jejuia pallidilutea]PQV47706.1 hypothetical protein CLV33_10625 [Jejuia pallidilutea]
MKKSLNIFIIFSLVFLITDRLVGSGIELIEKKVYTGQSVGKVNQFISVKDSVDLIVFGSSRASHHVDAKVLNDKSYNMGVDGTRIGYCAALISSLKKKKQIILVHIDPITLFGGDYAGNDVLSLLSLSSRNEDVKNIIKEIYPGEIFLSEAFKCYSYNGKLFGILKNYFKPSYNYLEYDGFDPLYPTNGQKEIFRKIILNTDLALFKNNSASDYPNAITDKFISIIKKKCEDNNSKLIFFTSPTMKKNSDELSLKTKVYFDSRDIEYFDFSNLQEVKEYDNWKDFTHLSYQGAQAFTKALSKRIYNN